MSYRSEHEVAVGGDNSGEWQMLCTMVTIQAVRSGWPGVWDALKSALRRDHRMEVPREVSVSVWIKGPGEVRVTQAKLTES